MQFWAFQAGSISCGRCKKRFSAPKKSLQWQQELFCVNCSFSKHDGVVLINVLTPQFGCWKLSFLWLFMKNIVFSFSEFDLITPYARPSSYLTGHPHLKTSLHNAHNKMFSVPFKKSWRFVFVLNKCANSVCFSNDKNFLIKHRHFK